MREIRSAARGTAVAARPAVDRSEVRIQTPCSRDWQTMTPAAGGRLCSDCRKVVRDLSRMTEEQARALLKTAGGGELCVRYVYDAHGRIAFGVDSSLVPPSLLSRARRVAAVAALGALPFATQACMGTMAPDDTISEPARTLADPSVAPAPTASTDGGADAGDAAPAAEADADGGADAGH